MKKIFINHVGELVKIKFLRLRYAHEQLTLTFTWHLLTLSGSDWPALWEHDQICEAFGFSSRGTRIVSNPCDTGQTGSAGNK